MVRIPVGAGWGDFGMCCWCCGLLLPPGSRAVPAAPFPLLHIIDINSQLPRKSQFPGEFPGKKPCLHWSKWQNFLCRLNLSPSLEQILTFLSFLLSGGQLRKPGDRFSIQGCDSSFHTPLPRVHPHTWWWLLQKGVWSSTPLIFGLHAAD